MQFESANPSVVRSIKQRELLNAWLRARAVPPRPLPHVSDYRLERVADEKADMMGFDATGVGDVFARGSLNRPRRWRQRRRRL